jgi:hypothetical protein
LQFVRVGDRLRTIVHIALTARSEPHSRFVAPLEEAERTNIEGEKKGESPRQSCAAHLQQDGEGAANNEARYSDLEPLPPPSRAYVGYTS